MTASRVYSIHQSVARDHAEQGVEYHYCLRKHLYANLSILTDYSEDALATLSDIKAEMASADESAQYLFVMYHTCISECLRRIHDGFYAFGLPDNSIARNIELLEEQLANDSIWSVPAPVATVESHIAPDWAVDPHADPSGIQGGGEDSYRDDDSNKRPEWYFRTLKFIFFHWHLFRIMSLAFMQDIWDIKVKYGQQDEENNAGIDYTFNHRDELTWQWGDADIDVNGTTSLPDQETAHIDGAGSLHNQGIVNIDGAVNRYDQEVAHVGGAAPT
ncbi:hypothetical protein BKA66DRAFT_569751 [Pyrenochaeta sp. MPI-SDFR-AT-0127]|nr:hypothetical protein BKA66DRAFT_569751 [Pyrenochaeta sp. MPI-SDFR-AT-0127]